MQRVIDRELIMSTATTLANLLEQLGNIAPDRVLLQPPPGMATERDVEQLDRSRGMSCELVDGVLVEKGLGYEESLLACVLIEALRRFVVPRNLGLISGESGMMRLFPGLVRMPDVAFASWSRNTASVMKPSATSWRPIGKPVLVCSFSPIRNWSTVISPCEVRLSPMRSFFRRSINQRFTATILFDEYALPPEPAQNDGYRPGSRLFRNTPARPRAGAGDPG